VGDLREVDARENALHSRSLGPRRYAVIEA
jgi:hypothetical protein